MSAYYNEIDPSACAVLRELIARDVIAPGDVDDRSIKEVTPNDLHGYTQVHFFAGGGLWSVAARLAGWPDERPLWTGSCPCQPFSAAGKGAGTDDPRHLWPDLHRLVSSCRPPIVMGEQVAGAAGYGWFDGVRADLARETYACRAVDIPACAIDAPHQRNRLYWIALDDGISQGLEGQRGNVDRGEGRSHSLGSAAATDGVLFGDAESIRRREGRSEYELWRGRDASPDADVQLQSDAATERNGRELGELSAQEGRGVREISGQRDRRSQSGFAHRNVQRNGSWWADAEWIVSPIDGKARRTKPGLPFLVDGLPGRVDLWRVGGNAISPILAAEVIAAFLDTETAQPALSVSSKDGTGGAA